MYRIRCQSTNNISKTIDKLANSILHNFLLSYLVSLQFVCQNFSFFATLNIEYFIFINVDLTNQ